MRKVFQPTTRKVYTSQTASPSPQALSQGTTIRRLHNNSISDSSPRILKQTTLSRSVQHTTTTAQSNAASTTGQMKCYVCDCFVGGQGSLLLETVTNTTNTKLPNKIGRVIGDSFLVIVRADDIVCKRCVTLFNQYDQVEMQLDNIKNTLMGFISKKYAIDGVGDDTTARAGPAAKLQKMNTGQAADSTPVVQQQQQQQQTVVRKVMAQTMPGSPGSRKAPVKIYKCMSCEFTTSDLKQFTPHYAVCPGVVAEGNGPVTSTETATVVSTQKTVTSETTTQVVAQQQQQVQIQTQAQTPSPSSTAGKVLARRPVTQSLQKAESAANGGVLACTQCQFKARDKATMDEHMRRHQVKVKPFKCRICSARFEDRETASKHARAHSTEYYKCGTCSVAYRDRNQLIKHFEVHRNDGTGGQQIIIKASTSAGKPVGAGVQQQKAGQPQTSAGNTQRLLQETIDEACNDATAATEAVDAKNIHFFSCSICSLTFIQENYYTAHMETHKQGQGAQPAKKAGLNQVSIAAASSSPVGNKQAVKKANGQGGAKGGEMNDDLESIFEKMHSEKSGGQQGNDVSSTGIDMPALGEDDAGHTSGAEPVSMPSLDDDAEAGEGAATQEEVDAAAAAAGNNTGGEGGVPMEIDDMQNSVEGGEQLKFIVNENGQLLQLDNHILTDAEGNQIIVQGADSEHLQQLLQSVAGLEGGTIQMIQGENNQMILVQQDGNEPQLIDASMLNAEGQLVLQQAGGDMSQDGTEEQQQQQMHEQELHGGEQHEQEQVQYAEAEVGDEQAHQEAVAVLAAGLLQAEAESTGVAVDESSQEDLGGGQQVSGVGGEEEEQSQEAHEDQQTQQQQEVCQAADETSQEEEQQAVVTNSDNAGVEDYDQLIPPC